MAVIDREVLGDIGVTSGDFVSIERHDGDRTVARVWPSDSAGAGREIMSKYHGESEEQLRVVFEEADENAPAIVFIDEIDSIALEHVVSQLLTELDGLEEMEDVVVIATTNRPDLIDDALLRPGRLDHHVGAGAPDEVARRELFEIHTRDKPLVEDVDLDDLAARTDGLVGADIEAACREAAVSAVREYVGTEDAAVEEIEFTMAQFEQALEDVRSEDDRKVVTPEPVGTGPE